MKKSRDSDWCRRQQAKPACSFFSDDAAQAEIDTGRQTDGENCANKLPRGQAEKDGFPVCADFFWNFDFDMDYLLSYEIDTEKRVAHNGQRAFPYADIRFPTVLKFPRRSGGHR